MCHDSADPDHHLQSKCGVKLLMPGMSRKPTPLLTIRDHLLACMVQWCMEPISIDPFQKFILSYSMGELSICFPLTALGIKSGRPVSVESAFTTDNADPSPLICLFRKKKTFAEKPLPLVTKGICRKLQ